MRTTNSLLVLPLVLGVACLLSIPRPALGQGELNGSQSVLFDPSIEASGMGGGGVAYLWRDEPNSWSNPALLGVQEGLRYSYGTTQIAPVLLDDAHIKSHRISLGHGGVGLLIAGKPFEDVGKDIQLDYGTVELTDVEGNVIATTEPNDEVRSIGVGVSVLDLVSTILVATGGEPIALCRHVSLMVGHTWKDFAIDFGPFGQAEGEQKDRGAAIRISPIDQIGDDLLDPSERNRCRLDLSGGYAQLNYDEGGDVVSEVSTDPVFELRRAGVAGRFTVAFPTQRTGWIQDFVSPTVSLGVSWESNDYYDDGESFDLDITRTGQELVIADVLYLRHGHVEDEVFQVDDETWGIGVSVRYRQTVGVRFDYGEYPYARAVEPDGSVDRYGITAFVDPFRLLASK